MRSSIRTLATALPLLLTSCAIMDSMEPTLCAAVVSRGYQPWVRSDVHAESGPFGVVTARLQAELVRQPF